MTDEGSAPASDAAAPAASTPAVESAPPAADAAPEVASAAPLADTQNTEAAPPDPAVVTPAPEPAPAPSPENIEVSPLSPEPEASPLEPQEIQEVTPQMQKPEVSPPTPAPAAPAAASDPAEAPIKARRGEALERRREKKQERIEKIFELRAKKSVIRNDDVEWHLKCSDETATKYLNALVLQGRLRRFGVKRGTRYEFL